MLHSPAATRPASRHRAAAPPLSRHVPTEAPRGRPRRCTSGLAECTCITDVIYTALTKLALRAGRGTVHGDQVRLAGEVQTYLATSC